MGNFGDFNMSGLTGLYAFSSGNFIPLVKGVGENGRSKHTRPEQQQEHVSWLY